MPVRQPAEAPTTGASQRDSCDQRLGFARLAASWSRSHTFRSSPPPYPVSVPLAPMTRWQGTITAIGLRPLASPTARDAPGLPSLSGELAVADGLTVGNLLQLGPHPALEIGAVEPDRNLELRECAGKVGVELAGHLGEPRGRRAWPPAGAEARCFWPSMAMPVRNPSAR